MGNGISKDTFKQMNVESKLDVLFDYIQDSYHNIEQIKKRPIADKCIAFVGGIIGGFLAALGLKWGG